MFRRWLIRLPFLLALTFVIALWITGYFGATGITLFAAKRSSLINSVQGLGIIEILPMPNMTESKLVFDFHPDFTLKNWPLGPRMLGFRCGLMLSLFGPLPEIPDSLEIVFPLWFPTLLLAGLNWFAWRKTTPKRIGVAFPVETKAKAI